MYVFYGLISLKFMNQIGGSDPESEIKQLLDFVKKTIHDDNRSFDIVSFK